MKKIIALLLVLVMLLALSACKKGDAKASDPTESVGATQSAGGEEGNNETQATGNGGANNPTEGTGGSSDPVTPSTSPAGNGNNGNGNGGNVYVEDEPNDLPEEPGVCSHNWGSATCTTGRICSMCGAEENSADALGHSWKDATCEAPKTCRRCGATEGKKLDHDFENGICTDCGEPDPNPPAGEDELPVL